MRIERCGRRAESGEFKVGMVNPLFFTDTVGNVSFFYFSIHFNDLFGNTTSFLIESGANRQ